MTLMLKQDGIILKSWAPNEKKYHNKLVPYSKAFPLLMMGVEDVEGAAVANLVEMFRANTDIYAELFEAPYLEELLCETIKDDPSGLPGRNVLQKVEISWGCESSNYGHGLSFEFFPHASGVGPSDGTSEEYGGPKKGEIINNYGLDFTPLCELAPLPLSLDENVKMNKSEKKNGKFEFTTVDLGHHQFTLFEIVQAILDEVSFFGPPSNRDSTKDMLIERVREIDSGEAKTIPFDEVKKKLEKKLKDLKKKKGKSTDATGDKV